MTKISNLYKMRKGAVFYFLISCFVTLTDIVVVLLAKRALGNNAFFHLNATVAANTAGVVTGFILHYLLSSKFVFFESKGVGWLVFYIFVSVIGLVIANFIIWLCHDYYGLNLLIGKFLSILIPYFFMYYARKIIYRKFFE